MIVTIGNRVSQWLAVVAVFLATGAAYAQGVSNTWDTNAAGNWTTVTNWAGDTAYAQGADNTATLGDVITADRIITLDAAITIGNITAADTTHNYTISGANVLTLDRTDATAPTLEVTTSTRTLTISSEIAGNDGLTKVGAGTLVLRRDSSSNTYTGTTTLEAGVLQGNTGTSAIASIANPFGTSALRLNSGTLQLRADSAASGATATQIPWDNNTTVGGDVTINVARVGGSGSNKIHRLGTLSIGGHTLTASDVTNENHDLQFGATTLTGNASFNVVNASGAMNLTLGDVGESGGARSVTKTGAGTLTLSGNNTYTGGTVISGGTLAITSSASLGAAGNRNLTFTGNATLAPGNATYSLGTLAVNGGTASVNAFTGTMTFGSATGSGGLTFNGANNSTAVLDLGNASAFTGTLQNNIGGTGNIPTKTLQFTSLGDGAGSALQFGGGDSNGAQSVRYRLYGDAGPLTMTNRQVQLLTRTSNNNDINRALLQNDNTNPDNKWVISQNLANSLRKASSLEFRGSNTGANEFAGAIVDSTNSGTFALGVNKVDAGNWSLSSANNTFTGTITLGSSASGGSTQASSNGTLSYASAGGANPITFNLTTGGATLSYIGPGTTMSGAMSAATVTSGTVTLDASGSGAINYSNAASLGSAVSGNKRLILSGTNTGDNTLAGAWVNNTGGAATLTKNGGGKWVLSGTNTYTGATTITAGVLQIGAGGATGSLSDSSAVSVSSGATLAFNRSDNLTYGGTVSGAGGGLTKLGAGKLTLTAASTYTGPTTISSGTLALGAAGSFANSGSIVVGDAGSSGAVLDLSAKSSLTIGSGQTLTGIGTTVLGPTTTLTVSGTFSPGNSPGLFTYDGGSTTLAGTTLMEITGSSRGVPGGYDAVNVTNSGLLTLGGSLTLDFSQSFADNTVFDLFSTLSSGSLAGAFGSVTSSGSYVGEWTPLGSGTFALTSGVQTLTFSSSTGDIVIVPEPATLALVGIGIAGLVTAAARRRMNRRS